MNQRVSPEGYVYAFALHQGLERRVANPVVASPFGERVTGPVARQSFIPVEAASIGHMSADELKFVARLISEAVAAIFGDTP